METLLDAFDKHFVTLGNSKHTIIKYRKDLHLFFRKKNISRVNQITKKVINEWIYALRTKGRSTGYIANHLWALKAFLKFLKEETNLASYEFDIQIPRVEAPEVVEYLEPEELEKLFEVIPLHTIVGLRLRTFIEVMINTGLRPSEALALQRADIQNEQIDIVGKGGKQRKVYINDRVREWANIYISERTDDHEALFVSHNGEQNIKQLSLRHTEHQFKQHFQAAEINKKVVLHTLRHTYATTLLANGCPLDYVALLLGHADVRTTRRHYVAIQHKHAKKAHFRYLSYEIEQDTKET